MSGQIRFVLAPSAPGNLDRFKKNPQASKA
jgi:hypothetical protein